MYSDKKITKEDTWRPDDLVRHLQGQDKSQRRERSRQEEAQRTRESTEHTQQDPERERQRERESARERANLKEAERNREEESRRKEQREKERRKEQARDGHRAGENLGWERRTDRDEKERRDREQKELRRYKDREREEYLGRHREREREKDREKERFRGKDREREGDRWTEKEREKQRKDREKNKERNREKERERERERERQRERGRDWVEGGGREKDRDRRRAERDKERKTENERRKEKEGSGDVQGKRRERERERERERGRRERPREREREREYPREQEEWMEQESRENPGHRQLSGPVDREDRRERRETEKTLQGAGESVGGFRDAGETARRPHQHGGEGGAERERMRGREERDKHKEEAHEDWKSSSDQRHQNSDSKHSNRDREVEVDEEAVGGTRNEDYEEDFEDYEEDFEELDEDEGKQEEEDENGEREGWRELSPQRRDEVKAIQRAMEAENELVSSAHSRRPTKEAEPETQSHPAAHGRVMDFTAARRREVSLQAALRQQRRSAELFRLIDLDFSATETLLDLPPVSEYDMYIKSFGMSNTKQVYVQCREENTERDTQTEELDTRERWTQHPADTNAACGGPEASQSAPDSVAWTNAGSKQLATFLHSAAQVMAVLLEENRTEGDSVKGLHSHTHSLSFSDGSLQLNTKLPFLHGRQVTLLHFSRVQVHSLLSVHSPRSSPGRDTLGTHTLLCVWNIWEPSAPQRILICEAEVRSCGFAPGRLSLVFAGTAVGSVLLWDLRENSSSHMHLRVDTEEGTLRYPTFSTDAVLSGVGHFSSVVSVEPVPVTMETELRGPLPLEETLGEFQLGSLDEHGLLILWVVVELPKADDSGSQTDLGLRPGGKFKLLHSSSLQTCDSSTSRGVTEVTGVMPHLSLLLKFLPSDCNHYFIGTSTGQVRRGTRHGLRAAPRLYTPAQGQRAAAVTTLDFCPNRQPFFLVGCSDGTVRLHSLTRAEPVCEWRVGSGHVSVCCVSWCPTRPTVFCVLDTTSVLHMWDLAEREDCPISSENLHPDRVTGMAMFGEAGRQSSSSGFALARQSGRLEIHFLKQSRTLFRTSDTETLQSLAFNVL